ncbi:MAG: GntR family transcriptional regulator, partial [Eubacterium sp.]|nr:GntR family transcriptional regulator [Eubacterium sp.]
MVKYQIIAQDIAGKIESGIYPGGSQLPLETELCEEYGVSRITIKKATDQLVQLGLITKRRGSGSFVKEMPDIKESSEALGVTVQFTGFSRQFEGRNIATEVNEFMVIPATGEIAKKMMLTEENLVYYICRTRFVDNVPYVVEYTYMPVDVIPGLNRKIVTGSIYSYILDTLQLKPQSAHRNIRALLASSQEKKFFRTTKAMPILEIEQVAYLDDGR